MKPKVKARDSPNGRDGSVRDKEGGIFNIPVGTWMFVLSASVPFSAFTWAMVTHRVRENIHGILWCSAISNALLAVTVRVSELSKEIKIRGSTGSERKNIGSPASASVCVLAAMLGIGWTAGASVLTHSSSSDLMVPLSCLLLICTRRNMLVVDVHPVALAAAAASTWWFLSAMYSIFIRGYAASYGISHFELNVGIFGDENVGFWNSDSWLYPLLTLVLAMVPLPAIVLGFLRRKGESEDVLFILALLSALPVMTAQCSSVRLLGVMGVAFGSWRCYDVGQKLADSNRLI